MAFPVHAVKRLRARSTSDFANPQLRPCRLSHQRQTDKALLP
ncbi:hypothetical protein MGAST_11160 [Mycobacterium gastri 'Wayne']|nr:hypothetical protein MGAST_11160 [Mycobacterium gastri 'Wayne']